jgi:branched-chain amino acid transport system permease protein
MARILRSDFLVGAGIFIAAAVVIYLQPGNYMLGQFAVFFIWATVATQWNLVFGIAGIFSIGHMFLFAVGGYSAVMISMYLGVPLWASVFAGSLIAAVASLVVGLATLRMRGPYVAILTLAVAITMYQLIVTDVSCYFQVGQTCYNFTGGARGLMNYGDFGFSELLGPEHRASANYLPSVPCSPWC